ncbi:hypothetical protein D9613_002047 [Agrocybe pediades]|uniref:Clavaminate synthase-like protein n=1 Tax=Agrocybe pediades TaxID=84607 RepID=A0A8H4VXF3_9AGAR|nr:hypothetical protein D9613_002047 [Agrocybe pediades]
MDDTQYTKDGVVVIPYQALVSRPEALGNAIEKAFGSDPSSLGIVIIRDLPAEYPVYRQRLLRLAYQFGQLDESIRERYSDPTSKYSFGWSHGKEIMNGLPDTLKGSYYANPIDVEDAAIPSEEKASFPEYYGENIWPKKDESGVEAFEEAFKDLFIFSVGCLLAVACQPFVASQLLDSTLSLVDLIRQSHTTKARLLHYFPPPPDATPDDDAPIDNWCGFHLDHSLLTGLCPAMFLKKSEDGQVEVVKNPSPTSGLYIRTRGGELVKASIPEDCIAFQTGEALEVATNKRLLATPHCVRVGSSPAGTSISRESFALFMQPNTNQALSNELTFGQFSKRIFQEHYSENNTM